MTRSSTWLLCALCLLIAHWELGKFKLRLFLFSWTLQAMHVNNISANYCVVGGSFAIRTISMERS